MNDAESSLSQLSDFFNEIGIISQLAGNAFQRVLTDDMTLAQFSVLNHFVRLGKPETPAHLARSFQVTKGAMTNTVKKLQQRGLVSVNPHPHDGRVKLVFITEEGRRCQADSLQALLPLLQKLQATVQPVGMTQALPLLREIRRYLDQERNPRDFPAI